MPDHSLGSHLKRPKSTFVRFSPETSIFRGWLGNILVLPFLGVLTTSSFLRCFHSTDFQLSILRVRSLESCHFGKSFFLLFFSVFFLFPTRFQIKLYSLYLLGPLNNGRGRANPTMAFWDFPCNAKVDVEF